MPLNLQRKCNDMLGMCQQCLAMVEIQNAVHNINKKTHSKNEPEIVRCGNRTEWHMIVLTTLGSWLNNPCTNTSRRAQTLTSRAHLTNAPYLRLMSEKDG